MRYWRRNSHRISGLTAALIIVIYPCAFLIGNSYALELSDRSVTISNSAPSATALDSFKMTLNSAAPLGSIMFEYCSNTPRMSDPCSAPSGLNVSAASLTGQTGNGGFSMDGVDSTTNKIVISRPASAPNLVPSTYDFTNVTNPSVSDQTTFVRISTYSSVDGSGSPIDSGSVAFSTQNNFTIGAYVPPFLTLCVGATVSSDCSQQNGFLLDLGTLSAGAASSITSQFAASTNDASGYDMYLLGTTMTSGNNIIPENDYPTPSRVGVSEFGINLRRNSSPNAGSDPSTIGTGVPTPRYDSPNYYTFTPGDEVAYSPISTDFTRMTVTYLVNVNPAQAPGIYSTTLTYLASAQF